MPQQSSPLCRKQGCCCMEQIACDGALRVSCRGAQTPQPDSSHTIQFLEYANSLVPDSLARRPHALSGAGGCRCKGIARLCAAVAGAR
eukprot:CAMPEP_0198593630 /NCGR_PEP_ID=MMETSP1462-20131121/139642_1 /TAXON_ID=1333877 /ORGANISM="Brandtodinium nutriculum, Strain RCC3387" /LENGTH=87 /DNA_ID=CAMNT_0044325233 /DNA_START=93 /DNA_END=353 /DNA_ORIENTATION=+